MVTVTKKNKKMSKETFVVTRRIELIPLGTKQEYKDIWQKLYLYNDTVYKMANTVIGIQYQNDLIINEVLDRDNQLSAKGKECKDALQEVKDWKESENNLIYEKYSQLITKDLSKKEKDNLVKARKEELKKVTELSKKKGAKHTKILRGLKAEATKLVMRTLNKSIENTSYGVLAEKFGFMPSRIRASLNQQVFKNFQEDAFEVSIGKRSIRSYKRGMPMPFTLSSFKFEKLKSKIYNFHWLNKISFGVRLGRDRSNNELVIERILSGEYKLCDSSIQLKNNKIFLLAAVRMPKEILPLNPNINVGVDLGISVPAYVSTNSGIQRMQIGSREEFTNKRQAIYAQRRRLQKDLQWNKGGKGRKKKLARLDKLETRERNFARTQNHIYSSRIIKFALENNAQNIIIEDLKGIARDEQSKWVLRNWSYFELQNMIEQKASKYGIIVEKIKAHDTSKSCSCCGHTAKENREIQWQFQCVRCRFEANADYNAALNISRKVNREYLQKYRKEIDAIASIYLFVRTLFQNKKMAA